MPARDRVLVLLVVVDNSDDPSYGWLRSVLLALWLDPFCFLPSVRCFFRVNLQATRFGADMCWVRISAYTAGSFIDVADSFMRRADVPRSLACIAPAPTRAARDALLGVGSVARHHGADGSIFAPTAYFR